MNTLLTKKKVFLNDKIARKILKNDVYGKKICAKLLSDLLDLDYQEVYDNLIKVSEDITFSALTIDNRVDALYSNDKMLIDLEINYTKYPSKPQDYNKLKEGIEQGKLQGILQKQRDMIINMYNQNLSFETIAKCADLSVNEVKEIISQKE